MAVDQNAISKFHCGECNKAPKRVMIRAIDILYTPQRFRKELVKAAQTSEGMVQVDRLNDILVNIGRSDQLPSASA